MEIIKIILKLIGEFVAKLEQGKLIVIVILTTMISIFIVVFLKAKLTQWIIKCYDFIKKNIIFTLIFTVLIYIIIQQYELAELIAQLHVSLTTELNKLKEALIDIFRKK